MCNTYDSKVVSVSTMWQHNDSKVVSVSTMWQHNDSKVVSVSTTCSNHGDCHSGICKIPLVATQ